MMKISLVAFNASATATRDAVGIDAVSFAIAVETERRNDGMIPCDNNVWSKFRIDALDFAGEQMVDALNDAQRMGDDGVGAGGAQIVGGEAFENFVRQPVRGGERELQGVGSSVMPLPSRSRRLNFLFRRQRFDLRGGAVDEHDADVQRAQHGDIQQDVGEIFVGHDRAVDGDDERLFPEAAECIAECPAGR